MRAVAQRVSSALVRVDHEVTGEIGNGLLVYVGAMKGDTVEDVRYLADKIANLRIFEDDQGKMSRSLIDVQGSALLAISVADDAQVSMMLRHPRSPSRSTKTSATRSKRLAFAFRRGASKPICACSPKAAAPSPFSSTVASHSDQGIA